MHTIDSFPVLVRAALLCAACDIPVLAKLVDLWAILLIVDALSVW